MGKLGLSGVIETRFKLLLYNYIVYTTLLGTLGVCCGGFKF